MPDFYTAESVKNFFTTSEEDDVEVFTIPVPRFMVSEAPVETVVITQSLPGTQGPAGPQGIQGIQGLKGDTGDVGPMGPSGGSYTHPQLDPASTWIVSHGLGYRPAVGQVRDTAGNHWSGQVEHISENVLTITFTVGGVLAAFAGEADLS